MSVVFGNSESIPGCFVKQKHTSGLKGASFSFSKSQFSVVTGFDFKRSDDFSAVKCLGDVAFINLFGKSAVAELDVTFQLFLIKGTGSTGILSSMSGAFDGNRLANKGKECQLTVGSKTLARAYVVSLQLSGDSSKVGLASATCHAVSLKDR